MIISRYNRERIESKKTRLVREFDTGFQKKKNLILQQDYMKKKINKIKKYGMLRIALPLN